MLGNTFKECVGLRLEMVELYWLLLTPITLITICIEFYKQSLNFSEIIRRILLSILLLYSFEYIVETIALLSDGIVNKMGGLGRLKQVLEHLSQSYKDEAPSWIQFKQMVLFIINILCYIITLMSFYAIEIVSQFLYAILYVISPLVFLCMIPSQTQHIPANLYKGITNIAIWRIIWAILGAMLFEFIKSPMIEESNIILVILTNLCIAISMLVVPIFTGYLLTDGGSGVASQMAGIATSPVVRPLKRLPKVLSKKTDKYMKKRRKNKNLAQGSKANMNKKIVRIKNPVK